MGPRCVCCLMFHCDGTLFGFLSRKVSGWMLYFMRLSVDLTLLVFKINSWNQNSFCSALGSSLSAEQTSKVGQGRQTRCLHKLTWCSSFMQKQCFNSKNLSQLKTTCIQKSHDFSCILAGCVDAWLAKVTNFSTLPSSWQIDFPQSKPRATSVVAKVRRSVIQFWDWMSLPATTGSSLSNS